MKKISNVVFECPTTLTNSLNLVMWNDFFFPLYEECYRALDVSLTEVTPHIDYDALKIGTLTYIGLTAVLAGLSQPSKTSLRNDKAVATTTKDWRDDEEKSAFLTFLNIFPYFSHFIQNLNIKTDLSIQAAEQEIGSPVDTSNFMDYKRYLDQINRSRWTRATTVSERQGGVSILGTTSEKLLEISMYSLIDGVNFFKVNNDKVNSYGDFVLMCLPNNLWLSVKSNYARERLLASGFSTDIIGVGYFTDKSEFTSLAKIRNFNRVGFLAMYIPDVPISQEQIQNNTNTYEEVINEYAQLNRPMPLNINGTNFLRPLSSIGDDMQKLLSKADISRRLVLDL